MVCKAKISDLYSIDVSGAILQIFGAIVHEENSLAGHFMVLLPLRLKPVSTNQLTQIITNKVRIN